MSMYRNFKIPSDLLELDSPVTVTDIVIPSAMQRKKSSGLYYKWIIWKQMKSRQEDIVLIQHLADPGFLKNLRELNKKSNP